MLALFQSAGTVHVWLDVSASDFGTDVTATLPVVPLIEPVTMSVAVMVWVPEALSVTAKVPTPPLRVLLAGRTAEPFVEVKCTVPE